MATWLFPGILPYLLLSVAMGICGYLFLAVKREIWILEKGWGRQLADLREESRRYRQEIVRLSESLKEAEERTGLLVPPTPPPSGLNLGKRTLALRMFRRGEGAREIAGALGLPRQEVELLVKVHRIVVDQN